MCDTLYIIGNGFDIHHGIPSRYTDFYYWLVENCDWDYDDVESFFYVADMWSKLEENMASFDYEQYGVNVSGLSIPIAIIGPEGCIGYSEAQDRVDDRLIEWRTRMRKGLAKWVKTLSPQQTCDKLPLKKGRAFYLTFNYTRTLEDLYKIPEENVLHIHGQIGDEWQKLELGHGGDVKEPSYNPEDVECQENIMDNETQALEQGFKAVSSWQKPVAEIIERQKDFWEKLTEVTSVYVFGFSFGEVDLPYIKKIAKRVSTISQWYICYYASEEKEKLRRIAYECGANNVEMLSNMEFIKSDEIQRS